MHTKNKTIMVNVKNNNVKPAATAFLVFETDRNKTFLLSAVTMPRIMRSVLKNASEAPLQNAALCMALQKSLWHPQQTSNMYGV